MQTSLPYDIESLFQRYYKQLCLFANNILHDEALAEDIVQSFSLDSVRAECLARR
ncbi:hypothetical protein KUH03_08310 [Sphingobacterium sp. E70]|uniref:hypothetical protein n=1 Tax=Sphingobacterium sp. E70 TaxID=2853439 RepID=UPI00211C0C06|nr:hypothetical protein [Sphingobacterium sp. E70]ULT26819.1 hypothetical protein KUH03_08310 [Sphingobacterium sp. E70]